MSSHQQSQSFGRPLVFGEVLFDCFPDGHVLGGAPFNVAWNLRGLGVDPLVVTAVGGDDLGKDVRQTARVWSIDKAGIQIDPEHPTGRVDIRTKNGEPTYLFWDKVAFDYIRLDKDVVDHCNPALFYHGSLALRANVSRQTWRELKRLTEQKGCPRFVDINLRLPHFDFGLTEEILTGCEHLKLNHEELLLIAEHLGRETAQLNSADIAERWQARRESAEYLKERFSIKNVWLTAAEEGAAWLGNESEWIVVPAPLVTEMVDTVGAGDALTAVIIRGLLQKHDPSAIISKAVIFAAKVCQLRGAISHDREFYALD